MQPLSPTKDQRTTPAQQTNQWTALFTEAQNLLHLKKTNFAKLTPAHLAADGVDVKFEEGLRLPGSKSPLGHYIYILFAQSEKVELVVHSKSLLTEASGGRGMGMVEGITNIPLQSNPPLSHTPPPASTSDYKSRALDFSSTETNCFWMQISVKDKENLILKSVMHVNGTHNFQSLLWQTCAGLDASFKLKATKLLVDIPLLEEASLERLIRIHLSRVGFKKIKEMNLPSNSKAFLVVLSNESDSVEDCWKRFPMRFEITSKDIITLRVYVSVNDKAHTFEKSSLKEAVSMVAYLNSHIPEGFYLLDPTYNQVHLIFRIICSNNSEENVKVLLQDYYEAAITVYKWSAWAFVQLALQGGKKVASPRDIAFIRAQVITRSPNERKCVVLNYDKKEKQQFEEDKLALEKIRSSTVLSKYLIPDAFLIPPNEMCVKVFTDTSLHGLEQAFREGTSAGKYITSNIFQLFDDFANEGVFPRLEMIKYKPSPMRLVLIPAKNFAASIIGCYGEYQALVGKCAIEAEREILFSPEVSLLYLNPKHFDGVCETKTGPKVKAKLAGDYYLLWRLNTACITKRFINFLEGYVAAVRSRLGEQSIEGLMATDDNQFEGLPAEDGHQQKLCELECVTRFYIVEFHNSSTFSPSPSSVLAEAKLLSSKLEKIHKAGCFHGFLCQETVRVYRNSSKRQVKLSLPCIDWKYITVLYPSMFEDQRQFFAPEIRQTYISQEPPSRPSEAFQKSDVFSLAKLISFWAPSYSDHPAVLAATAEDWTQRPGLQAFLKWVEEDAERSTLQPLGPIPFSDFDSLFDPEKSIAASNFLREFETTTVEARKSSPR